MALNKNALALSGWGVLAASFLLVSPARAIQIFPIDGNGNIVGGPISSFWTTSPFSPNIGSSSVTDLSQGNLNNWQVQVGIPSFAANFTDTQTPGIYGGGTNLPPPFVYGGQGYKVLFDVDAYTWDSYSNSQGLWDLFAVNVNNNNYYWNLVNGGAGAKADPVVVPPPSGTPVVSKDPTLGTTWGWGGISYTDGKAESLNSKPNNILYSVDYLTTSPVFVSAVLDTKTSPFSDGSFPSWGCFNANPGNTCAPPLPLTSSSASLTQTQDGRNGQPVPEPSSTLGFIALGIGGAASALKRKLKPSQSA